jgi:phosphoribosylanthranilate isomerase
MIVKICGLTNADDALHAADQGADMLGFILYPPSPRAIAMSDVYRVRKAVRLRHPGVITVGVFVNESAADMLRTLETTGLDYAQLSGTEPVETMHAMGGLAYKAIRQSSEAAAYANTRVPDALPHLLLEADHPTLYGGTGQRADDTLAAHIAQKHRLLLAGGLTPDNVAAAIRTAQPWGVDVASGVEAVKGKKDPQKVAAFIRSAKTPQP